MTKDVVEFDDEDEAGFGSDKFIVFSVIVALDNHRRKYVNLYFPNTQHTNYSGGSPITQASLASMYLMSGKWSDWFSSKLDIAYADWKSRLNEVMQMRTSNEVRAAIRSRYRALRRKDSQSAITEIKKEISVAKTKYERSRSARDYMREKIKGGVQEAIIPVELWGIHRDEWIKDYKQSLKKELNRLTEQTRTLRGKVLSLKRELSGLKDHLAKKFESIQNIRNREVFLAKLEQFDNEKDEILSVVYGGDERQFAKSRKETRDILEAIDNPYVYGVTVHNSLQKIAKEIHELLVNWILGAKAPDIADRTKENRESRGHSEDPPLNETGEFANSLKYEVI